MKPIDFKGNCKGVRLKPRGNNDPHICLTILTEDDECWFEGSSHFSSYWCSDLVEQLKQAQYYMETNCDPDMYDGIQYGWKFRSMS